MWSVFFNDLEEKKLKHTKVKNIVYDGKRNPQPYLLNSNFNNELCSLLFNLLRNSVNTFRDNFHSLYGQEPSCRLCMKFRDSQEHALVCDIIKKIISHKRTQEFEQNWIFSFIWKYWRTTYYYQNVSNSHIYTREAVNNSRGPTRAL